MRVITGTAKGRRLTSPGAATRPVTDRVKTSLFNILAGEVEEAEVLDLFAGAGSIGIEALSRGARHATFVENDSQALRALSANLRFTGLEGRATVVRQDVFRYLTRPVGKVFDLIYAAPPQYRGLWARTLHALDRAGLLSEAGVVVAQIFPKEYLDLPLATLRETDERRYGSTLLVFYRLKPPGTD